MIESLYIHVPFCSYKCPYCDFVSFTNSPLSKEEYLRLILKEWELYQEEEFSLRTIYLGGGTPSSVEPELYERFLKKLFSQGGIEEITVECNPENYKEEEFKKLRDLGINRVSIGVQSFTQKGLSVLGRRHSVKDSVESIHSAYKSGIENINVDLIYGYPGQGLEDLEEELKYLEDLPIKHVSCYILTPYEDTLFGKLVEERKLELPSGDLIGDMYHFLVEGLKGMGFEHYEVSNFAREGYECKHNLSYWLGKEFLGLGVSAWSFVKNVRFGNTKNLASYKRAISEGKKPVEYREVLDGKELIKDTLFIRLRTKYGIPKEYKKLIPEELLEFFEERENSLRLTERGMLLINEILLRIYKSLEA